MKVCCVTDGIYPESIGGMQKYVRCLFDEFKNHPDLQLTVIHPHLGVELFPDVLNIKEIAIENISIERNYLIECYKYSKRVSTILKQEEWDVIYAQGMSVWYDISKYADKLIVNFHGLEPYQATGLMNRLKTAPFRVIFNHIMGTAKIAIGEGGKLNEILIERFGDSKIEYLPNAVNLSGNEACKVKPDRNEKVRLLFVARFVYNKGIDILMNAVSHLNENGFKDKFEIVLIGKGPMYPYYKENNTHENVKFLGFASDDELDQAYLTSDLFVFPTLFEGMPTVVLEAMKAYLPIVVSNTGATRELVDDSNGYLIEAGNTDALIASLKDYISLSAEKKMMLSQASFAKVEANFTWHQVAKRHIEVFNLI